MAAIDLDLPVAFVRHPRALFTAITPSCRDQSAKVGIEGRGAGWKSIGGLSTGWRATRWYSRQARLARRLPEKGEPSVTTRATLSG